MNAPLKKAIENSLARRGITNMNYGASVVEGKAERMPLPLHHHGLLFLFLWRQLSSHQLMTGAK
jgi:hypothetical protein